jgi:prepilin-type N-terminal cleavage/methylation domain-containing protein
MAIVRRSPRRAFTLLELILALALGALLLSALYFAINTHLGLMGVGRKLLSQNAVSQVVMKKFTEDINSQIAPTIPKSSSSGGGGGSGSMSGGSSSTGGSSTGSGTSSSGSGGSSSGSGNSNTILFNLGVQGDDSTLTLYVSRYGKASSGPVDTTDDTVEQPLRSDLRRVYYFYSDAGGQRGLYRQEIKPATSDDALNPPTTPNPGDDGVTLIAAEVRSLAFEYWDGAAWQQSWDGTQLGQDGQTPLGPPLAIAVTVTIAPSGKGAEADDQNSWKTYRHVVSVLTANGIGSTSAVTTNSSTGGTSP